MNIPVAEQPRAGSALQPAVISYLSDETDVIDGVAELLHRQWGHRPFWRSRDFVAERLRTRLQHDAIPFGIVARGSRGQLLGTASVVRHELAEHTDKEFWLSEVCVDEAARGLGIGQQLTRFCCARAREIGATTMYLYTLRMADFYTMLGWHTIGTVVVDGLDHALMTIELATPSASETL
jgi:GNAT superfamily N-acetyltransferase